MESENLNRPRYKKQVYAFKLLSASFTILVIVCLQVAPTHAETPPNTTQIESVDFEKVYLGLWLNNIYSYQYTEGSYTVDFYLYFFWIDPNIQTIDGYLLNGYPVNPSTITLVSNDTSSEIKSQIYRITAACSTTPDAKDFPLDTIQLGIAVEMLTHGYNLEFVWLENETGIDSNFKNAGWETSNVE